MTMKRDHPRSDKSRLISLSEDTSTIESAAGHGNKSTPRQKA